MPAAAQCMSHLKLMIVAGVLEVMHGGHQTLPNHQCSAHCNDSWFGQAKSPGVKTSRFSLLFHAALARRHLMQVPSSADDSCIRASLSDDLGRLHESASSQQHTFIQV